MGKHDTKEQVLSWDPPADDYYKARIKELERANAELESKVRHLEAELTKAEHVEEQSEYIHKGSMDELYDRIIELTKENVNLKESLMNAVTKLGWENV